MEKNLHPQTPGATRVTAVDESEKMPAAGHAGDQRAPRPATLEELESRVIALEGHFAHAQRTPENRPLPDASEIDPKTIKQSVLTKQGWIVPEGLGSHPNAPKG